MSISEYSKTLRMFKSASENAVTSLYTATTSLSQAVADLTPTPSTNTYRKVYLLFCQITPTVVAELQKRGLVDRDGFVMKDVLIYAALPGFNKRLREKYTIVENFIHSLEEVGQTYDMPAFGDVYTEVLKEGSIALTSIVPYFSAIDTMLLDKALPSGELITKWLHNLNPAEYPEASSVANKLTDFLNASMVHINERRQTYTPEQHTEYLTQQLGEGWRARSGNLNTSKLLSLFGANEPLLELFKKSKTTKINKKGQQEIESLLAIARWVANYMALFKPTTSYNKGAISDMLNYAAMMTRYKPTGNLSDKDTCEVLRAFVAMSPEDYLKVDGAAFDMEPDDLAVLTEVHLKFPNAEIIRTYNNQPLADKMEALMKSKLDMPKDTVVIDPYLENGETVEGIYFAKPTA